MLLLFLRKPLLVPSQTGSSERTTAGQLSYSKRSIVQGQQSCCHPLTHYPAPGAQPAHVHIKHHSFLDTRFLHSLLTGPRCCPSIYMTHRPHFSMRAHFHFWCRHHQSPEDPSDLLLQPKLEHGIEMAHSNHYRSLYTSVSMEKGTKHLGELAVQEIWCQYTKCKSLWPIWPKPWHTADCQK